MDILIKLSLLINWADWTLNTDCGLTNTLKVGDLLSKIYCIFLKYFKSTPDPSLPFVIFFVCITSQDLMNKSWNLKHSFFIDIWIQLFFSHICDSSFNSDLEAMSFDYAWFLTHKIMCFFPWSETLNNVLFPVTLALTKEN